MIKNSVAYVSFGGGEHPHSDYEVLCGCNPHWIQVEGTNIPPNAVPSGESADGMTKSSKFTQNRISHWISNSFFEILGEPFFVGRVHHEGSVTPGKVQPSHGVWYEILFKSTLFELLSILIFLFSFFCSYIPYGGQEMAFTSYEVLTC